MKVFVEEHNPAWASAFAEAAKELEKVWGQYVVRVHHIGSTAIPGICAKPIVDLLPEVSDIEAVDQFNDAMKELGYEAMGEFGIPGRRYFRRNNSEGLRTHQIHAFEAGADCVTRHLAFRDFMRAHPDYAQEYSNLKRKLARTHPNDIQGYMDGKDVFIKDMEKRALNWIDSKPHSF